MKIIKILKYESKRIDDWGLGAIPSRRSKKISEAPTRCKTVDVDYVGQIKGIYADVNNEKGDFVVKTLPNEYEKVIGRHMVRDFMVNPIPLTKEVLEKNGFSKHDFEHIEGQHKWSWWRDTGTLVSLWCRELADDPGDGWMVRIESPDATCCRRVESVHELQHALRLCGVEKEIIL